MLGVSQQTVLQRIKAGELQLSACTSDAAQLGEFSCRKKRRTRCRCCFSIDRIRERAAVAGFNQQHVRFFEWAVQTFKSYRHAQDFTHLRIVMAEQLACSQRFRRLIG